MLQNLTFAINFIGLLVALWLGLYLVTRNSRRPEAWLSALALWSLSGYFLNQLLALYPPPVPAPEVRAWLYHLMLFWPRDVFEMGWKGWLLGWLPSYSIIFWYHATLYMLPGPFSRKRLLGVLAGYVLVLAGILVQARYNDAWANLLKDPLYNTLLTLPFYPFFAVGFITFAGLSVFNLVRATRSIPTPIARLQVWMFLGAVLSVGAAGLLGIVSNLLVIPVPQLLSALFLLVALLLAGIGVARYDAVLELRPLQRDLLYSAAGATAIVVVFLLLLRFFSGSHPPLENSYIFVSCLALISHSLISVAGRQLLHPHLDKERRMLPQPKPDGQVQSNESSEISERAVELALRNLHNYAYLADSPLSKLRLAGLRLENLEEGSDTLIDHGRAVSELLSEAVRMLRPLPEDTPNPPSRTWYPYIILWDAYVECRPNLEIMSRLYISEGTFNRTRRAAICSVVRLLNDMEARLA